MHEITGQYRNQWDQETTTCSCGWVGDTTAQWEMHIVEVARAKVFAEKRQAEIDAAKKALKVK